MSSEITMWYRFRCSRMKRKSVRVFLEKIFEKKTFEIWQYNPFFTAFCRAKMISSDVLVLKQLVRGTRQQMAKEPPRKGNSFHHFCSCRLPFPNFFPQFTSLVLAPTFTILVNKGTHEREKLTNRSYRGNGSVGIPLTFWNLFGTVEFAIESIMYMDIVYILCRRVRW